SSLSASFPGLPPFPTRRSSDLLIFLRTTFGDRCWHTPNHAAALVIDDPLVSRRYGFIEFESLLESARLHSYHVSLAFIPWNHTRSEEHTSELQSRENIVCRLLL